MALAQLPAAFGPLVSLVDSHFFCQIHTFQTREAFGCRQRFRFINVVASNNAAVLGAFFTQDAGQATGVDIGDTDHVVALEIGR